MSYPYIWTSYVLFLSSESKVLHSQGMRLLFICDQAQQRSVLQLLQNSFLAEGTTKGNSKTSVIYRLTVLNILGALVPPIVFFKRKEESFFSPQRSLTTNMETTSAKLPVFASTFGGCCKTSECIGLYKVCS